MLIAVIVMTIFGIIWWIAGAVQSSWPIIITIGIPIIISLGMIYKIRKQTPVNIGQLSNGQKYIRKIIIIISSIEMIVIYIAIKILQANIQTEFIFPVISIIVGIHFIPLALGIPSKIYYLPAILLVFVGILGMVISNENLRIPIVSSSAAIILWTTSVILLFISQKRGDK
jgi:hypothetical protein